MGQSLPRVSHHDLQATARRALALPRVRLAAGVIAVLLALPFYLAYFAFVLQRFGGVEFWIPRGIAP